MVQTVVFNYVIVCIGLIGVCCNSLWIAVYLTAYSIHVRTPRYPYVLDILFATQAGTDWIMSLFMALFNWWMISIDSQPQEQNPHHQLYFKMMTFSIWFTYNGSFSILVIIAMTSYEFLCSSHSKKKVSITKIAVIPTLIVLILSFGVGILNATVGNIVVGPSHIAAQISFYDRNVINILLTGLMMTVSTGFMSGLVYYYSKIIKMTKDSNLKNVSRDRDDSNKQTCVTIFSHVTGLRLHRLAMTGVVVTLLFAVAAVPYFINAFVELSTGQSSGAWADFLVFLPGLSYSAILNGFSICNCLRTYQDILKSIVCRCGRMATHVQSETTMQTKSIARVDVQASRIRRPENTQTEVHLKSICDDINDESMTSSPSA